MDEMRIRLIGKILGKNKEIAGYVVLDVNNNKAEMLGVNKVKRLIQEINCDNAKVENGEIIGTEASLNRLTEFNSQGQLMEPSKITILNSVVHGDKVIGFVMMDALGRVAKYNYQDTIKLIKIHEATNAKLVTKDDKIIVSAILGEFEKIQVESKDSNLEEEDKKFIRKYDDARYMKHLKKQINEYEFPEDINGEDFSELSVYSLRILMKVTRNYFRGRISNKVNRHYGRTIKTLKSISDAGEHREITSIVKEYENCSGLREKRIVLRKLNSIILNDEIDSITYKLIMAFYVDMALYSLANRLRGMMDGSIKKRTGADVGSNKVIVDEVYKNLNITEIIRNTVEFLIKADISSEDIQVYRSIKCAVVINDLIVSMYVINDLTDGVYPKHYYYRQYRSLIASFKELEKYSDTILYEQLFKYSNMEYIKEDMNKHYNEAWRIIEKRKNSKRKYIELTPYVKSELRKRVQLEGVTFEVSGGNLIYSYEGKIETLGERYITRNGDGERTFGLIQIRDGNNSICAILVIRHKIVNKKHSGFTCERWIVPKDGKLFYGMFMGGNEFYKYMFKYKDKKRIDNPMEYIGSKNEDNINLLNSFEGKVYNQFTKGM